jgi:hypothetical protein
MGWTATEDTLSQVEVSFPSAKAAMAYAPRQGLHYVMHGLAAVGANIRQIEKQNFTRVAKHCAAVAARMVSRY